MATYAELHSLFEDASLRNRVEVAVVVAARAVAVEDVGTANHANRLVWAKQAFQASRNAALDMMRYLLSDATTLTPLTKAQILGLSDATIQTAVNGAVNVFAQG